MTEKIVALHGGEVIQVAEPRESVIEYLEEVLEHARAGEIQAVAVVCLHADRLSSWGMAGCCNAANSFVGACAKLFYNVCKKD